jgi:hypothetical protein
VGGGCRAGIIGLPVYGFPFPRRGRIKVRRTVIASVPVIGIMVITVGISLSVVVMLEWMVIYRTTIVIVTTAIIAETHLQSSWNPTSVYPAITAPVVFPIARNPISIGIRGYCPITLYPNVVVKPVVPIPITFNPNIIR